MVSHSFKLAVVALACSTNLGVDALSLRSPSSQAASAQKCAALANAPKLWNPSVFASVAAAVIIFSASPVLADEYGVEKEAPTLFTGETSMICTKRGILGACAKTEQRTAANDNDKSEKYFKDPSDTTKRKDVEMRSAPEVEEGNLLVEKLRQQTVDNKEKNDLLVMQKTLLNDQSASFGPFDRQTVILNTDGKGFTLLQNPQAMRLKKAGFIQDRKFVKQPTEAELENALEADGPSIGGAISGFFGGVSSD